MATYNFKNTIGGFKDFGRAGISMAKAHIGEQKLVQSMVGPESVFGLRNQAKQKKVLSSFMKQGKTKEMRDYMAKQ